MIEVAPVQRIGPHPVVRLVRQQAPVRSEHEPQHQERGNEEGQSTGHGASLCDRGARGGKPTPHQAPACARMHDMILWTFLAACTPTPTAEAGDRPCMFDPADTTYKLCAHASMGACHHYTTTCSPDCMYDPASKAHKKCAHASAGKCHHYTTNCEPDCMFDPATKTYKGCAHASMGTCHHFTAACTP